MMGRNLESRIVKLETRATHPNDIMVVWRKPDGDIAEAMAGATFAKGDKVICAEWFEDIPMPAPRWYSGLRREMDKREYQQINRSVEALATSSKKERDAGFAPFPSLPKDRIKEMTDEELIHALLGVRT